MKDWSFPILVVSCVALMITNWWQFSTNYTRVMWKIEQGRAEGVHLFRGDINKYYYLIRILKEDFKHLENLKPDETAVIKIEIKR